MPTIAPETLPMLDLGRFEADRAHFLADLAQAINKTSELSGGQPARKAA